MAIWLWPYGYMKSIAAGKFKDICLKTLDEVEATRTPVVITKRGRPVAKLVPYVQRASPSSLVGSVVKEAGDPYGTGEKWEADGDPS
jgi:prevent-host-death family protein